MYFHFDSVSGQPIINRSTNTQKIESLNPTVIVDPKPNLINNKSGDLIDNVSIAFSINATRNGTVADGLSKLLLISNYKNPLKFSIMNNDANFSKGTLTNLTENANSSVSPPVKQSTIKVEPRNTSNQTPLVVAVYTPPSSVSSTTIPPNMTKGTVKIQLYDVKNSSSSTDIPISLYRVPVVLVHGLWSDPIASWVNTNFNKTLKEEGFNVYLANYSAHNAETFDPHNDTKIGNYGIDSIRSIINKTLDIYQRNGTATSQVDIVGHSMGGLMARGFVQQHDYKNPDNFMQGYIHRLITIGTPHYGGNLASILNANKDIEYCIDHGIVLHQQTCEKKYTLKDIFASTPLKLRIDKGGVEALVPGSKAYSDMCQTNVPSYAIAASWSPNANNSYRDIQNLYRNITDNQKFDLDINGFNGTTRGNNDLQVNLTSQLGDLPIQWRIPNSSILPNQSEAYNNTVHYVLLYNTTDTNANWELNSSNIKKDVALLLQSPQDKFAPSIGKDSPCKNSSG